MARRVIPIIHGLGPSRLGRFGGELSAAIESVKERTDNPFGVNLRSDQPDVDRRIDLMVATGVKVASFAQAPGERLVKTLKDQGVVVMPTVGARRHAEKVAAWGVDAVIAQGAEGGGHTLLAGDRVRTRSGEAHQLKFQDDFLHARAANGRVLRGAVAHYVIDGGSSGGRGMRDGQRHGECIGVVAVESAAARDHLMNNRAEGEDITTRIRGVALEDLRGCVGCDGLRLSLGGDQLEAGSGDRNIRWGEGAERTSFVVYLTEGLGQQCGITQSLRCGKWSFGQTTAES